jgi:branched-chain amino acid transport system substrate-binding protein
VSRSVARSYSRFVGWLVAGGVGVLFAIAGSAASAQQQSAKIAVALSLTGANASLGKPELDGIRLAVEEANATNEGPAVELAVYDDTSNVDAGKKLAHEIGAGDALLVLGPATTLMALETGRIYSDAGIVNIGPTTTGDEVTEPPNFFRAVASTGDSGETLARYLRYVLGGRRATVIFKDDGYGRSAADGFLRAAPRAGVSADYKSFSTVQEAEDAAREAAADPANPAIIIAAYDKDTVPVLTILRRQGARGPILGTLTMSDEGYPALFADQPEERQKPGFFTDGVYASTPMILDSSNAETLAFADRFRARFAYEPQFYSAQGYESARLALAAVRATGASDLKQRRAAIRAYLASLNSPTSGIPGLNGPLWFNAERGRDQPLRIGRFQNTVFVSAPVQLVPVRDADPAEIASGAVVDLGRGPVMRGQFASARDTDPVMTSAATASGPADPGHGPLMRRQQVVYTGMYVNEISRMDIAPSTFTADFYLWMRFARGSGAADGDPTDIRFPTLVRGSFDAKRPVAQGNLDDGTTYRLWQVTGEFKNDFDLHHYPADHQTLVARFYNSGAASDRIVYVQDRLSSGTSSWVSPGTASGTVTPVSAVGSAAAAMTAPASDASGSPVAPEAFRNLSQWAPLRVHEGRDILVTQSALGDPRLVGLERIRELSGFSFTTEVSRRVISTLTKTLLPLGLMALIMYASLYFPVALVKEKITVAITGALSGAVLLAAINSQLGNVGYVIALEYGFYVYFTLCLLCIVGVLAAERLRATGRNAVAFGVERWARHAFLLGLAGTFVAGMIAYEHW